MTLDEKTIAVQGSEVPFIFKIASPNFLWLRLSIAGGATLLVGMGLGRFSYSPLIPQLIEIGQLTEWQAGVIAASNFLGYLVGALVAPTMRRHSGETRTMRACLILGLVALFACAVPWGFYWLFLWRGLLGSVVGVMMIYCLSIATRHAPSDKLGAATGIVYTGVGIGILLSGSLIPWLLSYSLTITWLGIGAIGLTSCIVADWGWRGLTTKESTNKEKPHPEIIWEYTVVALIATRVLFSIGLIPHTIYWIDYIVRGLGNEIDFGGLHWCLFGLGAIGGTYLWGRLADKIGFYRGLVITFIIISSGVAIPVINSANWALIISSLVVGTQPGLTAIMSGRVHQLMGPENMAPVWRMSALLSTIIQAVAAYGYVTLFEYTDNYAPIFLVGSACFAMGALIAITLKGRNNSKKVY